MFLSLDPPANAIVFNSPFPGNLVPDLKQMFLSSTRSCDIFGIQDEFWTFIIPRQKRSFRGLRKVYNNRTIMNDQFEIRIYVFQVLKWKFLDITNILLILSWMLRVNIVSLEIF